ncbi:MAG: enoyl-CoA hydratase/isomerase family protein [Pseudomonadota bacterium]
MNQTAFLTVPEALSADTLAGMRGMLAGLSEQVPVVVLRGGKDVFCSGLALGDELAAAEQALVDFVEILLGLRAHPAAKLALVEGKALGGGVGLAAVCDLVVATHEARFALPEVLIGMTPATILPVLEERMSLQKTRAMMLDGGTVTAEEALAFGLVDRTCPPDRADRVMTRLSRTLRRAILGGMNRFSILIQ